jgi:RNA polymerase sigma-70 factor, ECF subfamily
MKKPFTMHREIRRPLSGLRSAWGEGEFVSGETDPLHQAAEVARWIAAAHNGDREALNRLLALCRPYLLLAANQDIDPVLRARVAPSDVVQDSLLEAARGFPAFQGRSEDELLAWLRRVLRNNLANERRRHRGAAMRSTEREVSLAEVSAAEGEDRLREEEETPSATARARERDEALERALKQLPEHYRQALLLHTQEGLTFAQVGERLGVSEEAARKLWSRASEKLAQLLEGKV